jgi:hypothetical protein
VLSPRAQERGCIELGIAVANGARSGEHVAGGLVGRAGAVVEVAVVADRLLEKLGDVWYVGGGDTVVGLRLCSRCVLGRGMQAYVELTLVLCLHDVSLDTHIAAAVVIRDGYYIGRSA